MRVLVVDEDCAARAAVVSELGEVGFTALGATGFHDAVRAFETFDPDVLVSRVRLGAFNGLHLMIRGQSRNPALETILIAPPDRTLAYECTALGASALVEEPVSARAIADAVLERVALQRARVRQFPLARGA